MRLAGCSHNKLPSMVTGKISPSFATRGVLGRIFASQLHPWAALVQWPTAQTLRLPTSSRRPCFRPPCPPGPAATRPAAAPLPSCLARPRSGRALHSFVSPAPLFPDPFAPGHAVTPAARPSAVVSRVGLLLRLRPCLRYWTGLGCPGVSRRAVAKSPGRRRCGAVVGRSAPGGRPGGR